MHYVQKNDQLNSDVTANAESVVAELNRKAQQQKLRPQYTCEFQNFRFVVIPYQHRFMKYLPNTVILLVHYGGEIWNKNVVIWDSND
jgi:hypothetical protein